MESPPGRSFARVEPFLQRLGRAAAVAASVFWRSLLPRALALYALGVALLVAAIRWTE